MEYYIYGMSILQDVVSWGVENKNWIFSGIGVAILAAFTSLIRTYLFGNNNQPNDSIKIEDSDIDGQVAGRDINVEEHDDNND
mgnify:FL=1